jgi:hypothetical protein
MLVERPTYEKLWLKSMSNKRTHPHYSGAGSRCTAKLTFYESVRGI